MTLKIYNTLTRTKEDFIPLMEDPNYQGPKKDFVGIYSCGPTVYYTPHIGNYRATFTADLIRNTLKILGYPVKAVMNITDVGHLVSDADDGEDKLEKGAKRDGITAREVAKKYEQIFKDGMKELNIDEFDVIPRATENIPEQIELVKTLEAKGYTYTIPGDGIYMDTSKVEDYGKLMGPNYKKRLADLNAGERIDMGGKKNPTDFALWKFSPTGEKRQMERESPRGIGFPGWHIECSAMSSKYLGQQFDIHHGGADHITIHHPNEIAQSECGFDVHPRVKYWMHNEFLQVDSGKMSKSLGNIYSLEDIKAKGYSPLDLRYFYFMAQYGNFQNFTWDALDQAKKSRTNLSGSIVNLMNIFNLNSKDFDILGDIRHLLITDKAKDLYHSFFDILSDDLDTPKLLSEIFKLRNLFSHIHKDSVVTTHYGLDDITFFKDVLLIIYYFDTYLLKLDLFNPKTFESVQIPADILVKLEDLANQRLQAKKDKNYALADELRNKVKDMGYEIRDTKDGFEIEKI